MKLIYSYSTKIGNYSDNDWQMQFFRASIIRAKEFGYIIKFYGCDFAYEKLKDLVDEYVDVTNEDFKLTDDLKLFIHSREDLDCVTIDGDIILDGKLKLPSECDMVYERKGVVTSSKSKTKFKKYLDNVFSKFDVESKIKHFKFDIKYACSVGILKFNNQNTKDLFLSSYYEFRDYFLNDIEPNVKLRINDDLAIIVCEYLFACLLEDTDHIGKECNQINTYTHYMSLSKFTPIAWRHVDSIVNPINRML